MRPASSAVIRRGTFIGRIFVALVVGLVRWWSPQTRAKVAASVGALAYALRIRRRVTLDNLAHAFPEKSEAERLLIARGAYRNMALAVLEAVTSDLLSDDEINRALAIVDWKGLDQIVATGKSVLVVSGHLGSWELFAEVMARRGYLFSAVVRPLTGAFNEWIVKNREAAGVELILQRGALSGMLKALKRGRSVVQLIDQSLNAKEALWVPFFGRPASTTPAISMASIRSHAPVYLIVALREADGLRMYVEGPVPVPERASRHQAMFEHTAALTQLLEGYIRRAPDQWLWLHRRWKGKPPPPREQQIEVDAVSTSAAGDEA